MTRVIRAQTNVRSDTSTLVAAVERSNLRLRGAEAALAEERAVKPPAIAISPPDTLSPVSRARRDSLVADVAAISRLLRRVESAPLPASYRALGEANEMLDVPGVRALLDSLTEVERSRAEFGAIGGVDPIFVSLTARAADIGRAIKAEAEAKRSQIWRQISTLTPKPVAADTARLARTDTMPFIAARAAAMAELTESRRLLAAARMRNDSISRRDARARKLASAAASPIAMLAASLVLGLALGFLIALTGEIRRPRISDASEAESFARAPVIARIYPRVEVAERKRRKSDHLVPPLIDLPTPVYRQLYAQLADSVSNLPRMAVIGDAAGTVATVAANLATAAIHASRTAILADTDFDTRSVSSVMRVRSTPGLGDVLARRTEWTSATVSAVVGRDYGLAVLTAGSSRATAVLGSAAEALAEELAHLGRHYDTVIVSAPASRRGTVAAVSASIGEVIICVRVSRTYMQVLQRLATEAREAGATVRGVVLWDTEDPVLEAAEEEAPLAARRAVTRTERESAHAEIA
ncbi:MAG: hypothetical protein ACR2G6_01495 [Gemmatimonadaceae bacterium]